MALVVTGMNDVINAQGYTQAAWWNHVPISAMLLMGGVALMTPMILFGWRSRRR